MRAKTTDVEPVLTSSDGRENFGWYQGVAGQLGAHVAARAEAEALSHIRRLASGEASPRTLEIVEELEAMAPGARALLDSLGAGYRPREKR